jgi:hypothetical protein
MISTVSSPDSASPRSASTPFDKGWVPQGYKGPVALPGTGRMVYWTGRIAIGLRYAPPERVQH